MDDLQRDVRFLFDLLDGVTGEQAGPRIVRLIEDLRQLSRERRVGLPGAEDELVARIAAMTADEVRAVVPALTLFFDLANMAEDTQRVRVLREREREAGDSPRHESIRDALLTLKARGDSPEHIQRLLGRLSVDLVFTAHPTEAKRRTTRRLIRSLRESLHAIRSEHLLARERERVVARMRSDLTILSQIDLLRPQRPTVTQEVERGLFFIEELWKVVPRIDRELRSAAAEIAPKSKQPLRPFLKFGSWIGGDRDGNPFVTPDVTAETLKTLRSAAINRHLTTARQLYRVLVMSDRSVPIPASIHEATDSAIIAWPALADVLQPVVEAERYRRWLRVIEWRLERTLAATSGQPLPTGAYGEASQLLDDVSLLADALRSHRGDAIAEGDLDDWIAQVQTFGLHFAALDVRQDSRVHIDVLAELFRGSGRCEDYASLDEQGRRTLLVDALSSDDKTDSAAVSSESMTRETLALFRLLGETVRDFGMSPLGGHVISMTHQLSDVLAVLWLWRRAWKECGPTLRVGQSDSENRATLPHLPIIPLFETIDDLDRSADVLEAMLSDPTYLAYLKAMDGEPKQTVMVGYSDSTKDGGYLAASWGLHRAQERLAEVADRHAVRLVVFHGRGGALGRGGGPAARAILSLPPKAVDGALRMTEQGEVLAERYDDPQIAHRHLEQVSWATLLVSGNGGTETPPERAETMERLSQASFKVYRKLVEHVGFLEYFDLATPIGEIENLPIGSRPARRRERKSLSDLRAIPWTFAWTQSRHIIPAWYGLGSALEQEVAANGHDWSVLQAMYDAWPLFSAVIDNAELALAKADMGIARRYAELAAGTKAEPVAAMIRDEFSSSRAAVLLVTRQHELLGGIPWLQRSILERNPYVDPLNLIQIELIRRLRALPEDAPADQAEKLRELIRLTIQGVAAGLRTTG
ncbi:MAG: phosphoenolpyruvate carboxylase [Planctomycetota bacterium]|nr:phosphoenolpyruvate carboxylase [Planctomycetaceae bacterium]MDQ3329484.1 phosphoenolpyruvate carboxylase [Planctomycetota bacterium]